MSGHSKWNSIKHQKAAADSKRANVFTKLAKNIVIAAKQNGGDPEMNFSLRLAIDKAKQANMPKDNIEKAIKRGTGELEGGEIIENVYEAFGPEKVGLIITTQTDNVNRTVSDIKTILNKNGGEIAGQNAVSWNFDKRGIIFIAEEKLEEKDLEALELAAIDAGALDIQNKNGAITMYTEISDLHKVLSALNALEIEASEATIGYVPKNHKELSPEQKEKLIKLIEKLEENDDVDQIFHNAL